MKNIIIAILLISANGISANVNTTKHEHINKLFYALNDKEYFSKTLAPALNALNVTDSKIQEKTIDTLLDILQKEFVTVYDTIFSESEIKEMLQFYNSPIGKKQVEKRLQIDTELNKVYMSFVKIAQKLNTELSPQANKAPESKSVIKFEELAKDKNSEEVFKNEINHEGLTIVKFSAVWCGPCKTYAPIFSKFADAHKEMTINGKKTFIKYLAIDVDEFPAVATLCSVTAMPTTIFYKNGEKKETIVGLNEKALAKNFEDLAK